MSDDVVSCAVVVKEKDSETGRQKEGDGEVFDDRSQEGTVKERGRCDILFKIFSYKVIRITLEIVSLLDQNSYLLNLVWLFLRH